MFTVLLFRSLAISSPRRWSQEISIDVYRLPDRSQINGRAIQQLAGKSEVSQITPFPAKDPPRESLAINISFIAFSLFLSSFTSFPVHALHPKKLDLGNRWPVGRCAKLSRRAHGHDVSGLERLSMLFPCPSFFGAFGWSSIPWTASLLSCLSHFQIWTSLTLRACSVYEVFLSFLISR